VPAYTRLTRQQRYTIEAMNPRPIFSERDCMRHPVFSASAAAPKRTLSVGDKIRVA
jgi:hypothetical protein